ncbi:MAG TPA: LapD/MoxY N-terminal periplasmic domain-containing protein [Methylophilaceae bacterium]|nr:LapD/MoxY N-terminal periplasmic domain-containing protein [Methylophilaceae bacterium]
MSLIKKLWIAIVVLIALAFGGSFVASTITAKNYLQQQLQIKNIDNATSLALSLSQMDKDPVKIELMLAAQFDSGHYQYISLIDPTGHVISERRSDASVAHVPNWFTKLIPIKVNPGIAQVQNGWMQYGTLHIESQSGFAYQELWKATLLMLFWSLLMIAVSGILGTLALRRILQPLNTIVNQAEAIGDRRFITVEEPQTLEFKALVAAMNRLATRIKNMLGEESRRLEQLRVQANHDPISGLMNADYFLNRVNGYIAQEEGFAGGILVMTRIAELAQIDRALGRKETDALLKRLGEALEGVCGQTISLMAGRLNGTDLAFFSGHPGDSFAIASQIKGVLAKAAGLEAPFTHLALPTAAGTVEEADKVESLAKLLATTLAEIGAENADLPYIVDQGNIQKHQIQDEIEWRKLLVVALDSRMLKLAHFPVLNTQGMLMHYESPVRLQVAADEPWIAAGQFIPWAIKFDLVTRIDNVVAELAIEALRSQEGAIGLNISTRAMCNPEYVEHLHRLLQENASYAERLWLEVPEQGVFEHLREFRDFTTRLKPFGCKIGIEHVGAYVARLGELHDLGLDYIKIDASLIRGISSNPGNKAFLRGLCLIAHTIGWLAIAEGVEDAAEVDILPELGIDAMTGPAIKM